MILNSPAAVRIFAYALPTDMRKSFDGLHALVTNEFTMDVLSGDCFVFFDQPTLFDLQLSGEELTAEQQMILAAEDLLSDRA